MRRPCSCLLKPSRQSVQSPQHIIFPSVPLTHISTQRVVLQAMCALQHWSFQDYRYKRSSSGHCKALLVWSCTQGYCQQSPINCLVLANSPSAQLRNNVFHCLRHADTWQPPGTRRLGPRLFRCNSCRKQSCRILLPCKGMRQGASGRMQASDDFL